jgi:dihydrofolate reductase
MRKLIFQQFLSLDGLAADADDSTKFFETPELSAVSDDDLLAEMQDFDTILLGANTYRMFAEYWPTATTDEQIVADKLNSIPKVVFSKSLKKAPWGKWPAARIVTGDAIDEIRKLKALTGKNMVLWGSISLSQALMKAKVIDEYHFRICPVVLGTGRSNFDRTGSLELELFESKQYSSGLMLLKYRQR